MRGDFEKGIRRLIQEVALDDRPGLMIGTIVDLDPFTIQAPDGDIHENCTLTQWANFYEETIGFSLNDEVVGLLQVFGDEEDFLVLDVVSDDDFVLPGSTSSEWMTGSGAPAGGLGETHDFYLNVAAGSGLGDVYEKTGASTWVLRGNIRGATGPAGTNGTNGTNGANGPPNTLSVGTVTTGSVGGSASASITGTAPSQTLNLVLPTGATGPANVIPLVTSLPGSPVDGQEVYLQTATSAADGNALHLRWRASASAWDYVGARPAEAWVTPTLTAGFTAGAGADAPSFSRRLVAPGIHEVYGRGLIYSPAGGASGAAGVPFTFPVGYRPAITCRFLHSGGSNVMVWTRVDVGGAVNLIGAKAFADAVAPVNPSSTYPIDLGTILFRTG